MIRNRIVTSLLFAALAIVSVESPGAPQPANDVQFVAWARANLHEVSLTGKGDWTDLEPLLAMLGPASIVSLGEGLHGSAEPLEFRNRLFQFLVERAGFTAITLESGLSESYAINEYVRGGSGNAEELTLQGITNGLAPFPQQAQLVRWMHEYNLDARHARKIELYGMDLSGFPGQPSSPFDFALGYLDRVDPLPSKQLRERIAPMLPFLKLDRFSDSGSQYPQLPQGKRDAVTAVIADMIRLFETKEGAYIRQTGERQYELAHQAALAARQVDDYLRQVPVGWTPRQGMQSIMGTVAVSDRAKLDNIEWLKARQGSDGKVLVFTHLGHAAPTTVSVQLGPGPATPLPPLVGTYLKRRYGERLVTIGHFFAQDDTRCGEHRDPAPANSLEGLFASLGKPAFVLDLRAAPAEIVERFNKIHGLYGQLPVHSLRIDEGVDIVLFTQRATPANACPKSGQQLSSESNASPRKQ
jgi:erythromycin esterase